MSRQSWLCRLVRGVRPDRNPLRRGTDRLEACLIAVLFVASAAAAPFAAQAASHAAYQSALHAQQEQLNTRHKVPAVLTTRAGTTSGYALQAEIPTQASWTSVTGKPGSGEVLALAGSPKGTIVKVWTDDSGNLVSPPLVGTQVSGQGDVAAIVAVAGIGFLFLTEAAVLRHVLYRRRMAAWDADWLITERAWHRQS